MGKYTLNDTMLCHGDAYNGSVLTMLYRLVLLTPLKCYISENSPRNGVGGPLTVTVT